MQAPRPLFVIATLLAILFATAKPTFAQLQDNGGVPMRPTAPTGYLGPLGTYRTIEGVLYDGGGKVESNTLVVHVVDGQVLEPPLLILVRNVRLPAKVRCVLKGYELGEMIGRPPAEYALTRELGGDPGELAQRDPIEWRWRPFFVPLIATEPEGLEITTQWGK